MSTRVTNDVTIEEEARVAAKTKAVQAPCPKGGVSTLGQKFCPECGAKIVTARFCEGCGRKLAPGAKFCGNCGAKVTT